jgi:predicted nicotinamide N-methyase
MTIFGTYANADYGWDRTGKDPSEVQCLYWRYAWNQGLELVAMMLDEWDYTQERRPLEDQTLPMAKAVRISAIIGVICAALVAMWALSSGQTFIFVMSIYSGFLSVQPLRR